MRNKLINIIVSFILILCCKSDNSLLSKQKKAFFYYNKAYKLIDNMKLDEALISLEQAIKYDPIGNCNTGINGNAHNEIGYIYFLKKDFDTALIYYNKCLKINPDNGNALLNRTNIYVIKKEWEKGIIDMTHLLKLTDSIPIAYFQRGTLYHFKKEYKNALNDYEKFLKITEQNDDQIDIHKLREDVKELIIEIKNAAPNRL